MFVNGLEIDESGYIARGGSSVVPPVRVPADSYFVLGDNRSVSEDSRRFGSRAAGGDCRKGLGYLLAVSRNSAFSRNRPQRWCRRRSARWDRLKTGRRLRAAQCGHASTTRFFVCSSVSGITFVWPIARHEVGVARPARHYVEVKVARNAGSGGRTEIKPDIESGGLHRRPKRGDG